MTNRLRLVVIGPLALATVLGMGWPPAVTQPPSFFNANPAITDQQRVSAMLSVHGHARFYGNPDMAGVFMPLSQAVPILDNDTGPAAQSRRRRAVAKLAAYNYTAFSGAVLALSSPGLVHEIETFLNSPAAVGLSKDQIEVGVMNVAQALAPDECRVKAIKLKGQVYAPPPVSWAYDILVPRFLEDIARAIDPQSWADCSLLFRDSYLVTTPSCCPFSETRDCSFTPRTGSPEPEQGPAEPRGKPYGWVAFFEEFCAREDGVECSDECENVECEVGFDNLLCVKTWYDIPVTRSSQASNASRYDVDYGFGKWMYGEFLGEPGYEIISNYGGLNVHKPTTADVDPVPPGAWSVVHVDKSVQFDSSGTTNAVGNWMMATAVEDELEGQIVEMACCDVQPQRWGPSMLARVVNSVRQFPNWVMPIWRKFWDWIWSQGG